LTGFTFTTGGLLLFGVCSGVFDGLLGLFAGIIFTTAGGLLLVALFSGEYVGLLGG
jgi:hypothetical protein